MVIPLRSVRCAHPSAKQSADRSARSSSGKSARRSARIASVALVPSLLLLGGCRSNQAALQAAQEFGTLASQFQVNTNKLADDIYDSCIRTAGFFSVDSAAALQARRQQLDLCEAEGRSTAANARIANQIVVDYIQSIGSLAADHQVSFDTELSTVEASLSTFAANTGFLPIKPQTMGAGSMIARLVYNWAANSSRQGALATAIVCSEQPLRSYTNGLDYAYREGYINGLLESERSRVQSFYNYYAGLMRARRASDKDFLDLQQDSLAAILPVLQRRSAAFSYLAIIRATANANSSMAKLFAKTKSPIPSSACAAYFLKGQSKSVALVNPQKAAVLASLSADQRQKLQRILLKYRSEVKPMLQAMEAGL